MRYTEIDSSVEDPSKVIESREYPQLVWDIMLAYRKIRCRYGLHKKRNFFGEKLSECKWCNGKN